jgi:predicted nucleic acid-binding protein
MGEAESIVLARSRQLPVILDDKEARAMAEVADVRYVGTAGLMLAAFSMGKVQYDELEEMMRALSTVMWIGPDVVTEVLRRARESRP